MSQALNLAAGVWLAALAPQTADEPGSDLMTEFEAVCLASRGAVSGIEAAALSRGYVAGEATQEEEAGSDRADPPPRVWSHGEGEDEVRVVSAPGRMRGSGPWLSVNRCYVDGPGDYGVIRAAARTLTGVSPFRQRETAVFAWTQPPEGPRGIRQAQFERSAVTLLRDEGLQMVLVRRMRDGVTLSYVVAAP